jgi:hypothetical protein
VRRSWAALFLTSASCASQALSELVVCGGDEVAVYDLEASRKIWSWKAAERPEIPEALRRKFGTTDDCKAVHGGRRLLITSSGGAAAVVERATGVPIFWAAAPNAHSAEALPKTRLVVACSTHKEGDRLLLFDVMKPEVLLASEELLGAHGAVLDEARGLLWALGTRELRSYALEALTSTPPAFRPGRSFALPNEGGHDLRPIPDHPGLVVTTHQHVWLFDRDRLDFRIFPRIGGLDHVKSVDVDPVSGALAFVKAETSWWAERVRLLDPERVLEFPGRKIYKARWSSRYSAAPSDQGSNASR